MRAPGLAAPGGAGIETLEPSGALAVFAMQLKSVSETFIQRHLRDLAPGRTVAVCRMTGSLGEAPCEAFVADRWALQLAVRLACRAGGDRRRLMMAAVGRFLRRRRVSHVLGEYLHQFIDFVPLLDAMGVPYVVQGHGLDLSSSLRDAGVRESYLAYRSARAILTRSEFHRQRLISIGLPAELIHVNPGGVDIPAAIPERAPAASKRFLAIGRMTPQKAPILLLESFRIAAQQDPELTLDYIGGGALYPAVWQFVEGCDLQDKVRLHGITSEAEKARLLAECGVFVQHSAIDPQTGDEEGLPAAIQEAMAHGLAVVSTRHAGIPEAVVDGETGLLVDELDVRAMSAAFVAVPGRARVLGEAGYRRAAAMYAWRHERARLRGWLFGTQA